MKLWLMIFSFRLTSTVIEIFTALKEDDCDDVNIVRREEWGARVPKDVRYVRFPVNDIFISHSGTLCCATQNVCKRRVQFIQNMDMDTKGLWDIAYNFLVGGDGNIYEGRGWIHRGFHAPHYNMNSYNIAFIGNFTKDEPTDVMLNAALNLIKCGVKKRYIAAENYIHGLRDVTCTDSPGDRLYSIIRCWHNFTGGRLPHYYCNGTRPFPNPLEPSVEVICNNTRSFPNSP